MLHFGDTNNERVYTPTLTCCSLDMHRLILIILGYQHQHTFNNYLILVFNLPRPFTFTKVGTWKKCSVKTGCRRS